MSPFLQRPFSQCLQTRLVVECVMGCLSGQRAPRGQWPARKAEQYGRVGGMPKRYSLRKKGVNAKVGDRGGWTDDVRCCWSCCCGSSVLTGDCVGCFVTVVVVVAMVV